MTWTLIDKVPDLEHMAFLRKAIEDFKKSDAKVMEVTFEDEFKKANQNVAVVIIHMIRDGRLHGKVDYRALNNTIYLIKK